MGEWFGMKETGRVRVEARPPFVELEVDVEFVDGNWRKTGCALLAEAVLAVEAEEAAHTRLREAPADEPNAFYTFIRVRDGYRSKELDARMLGYGFGSKDERDRFEHALLSALAHAGRWRRG